MTDAPKTRITYAEFTAAAAGARPALDALAKATHDTGLDPVISELVKLRASQINGCAFCAAHHLKVLRGHGVEQRKLDLLAVWHDSPGFSPAERAALAWAETLTHMAAGGVQDAVFDALNAHFSKAEIIGLTLSAATINLWNRLGVGFRFPPGPSA
jgi:AhpD family alkylhydroperoxidase